MTVSLASRMAVCAALLVKWAAPEATEAVSIERCRALDESAERLLCYDTLFPRAPASSGGSAPHAVPARPSDRSTDEGLKTPTASSHAPEAATQTFGSSAARERPAERISATVTELHQGPGGRFVVYLDNGQVWRQIETATLAPPRKGERVTIRRAALGSYMLETESSATHVSRIR